MIAFILIPGGWGMDRSSSIRHIPLFAYDVPKSLNQSGKKKKKGERMFLIFMTTTEGQQTHGILYHDRQQE
jgi:hypothetical protein